MDTNSIQSATAKLELINIVLHEAQLTRNPDHQDPLQYPADLIQQNKLAVVTEEATYIAEENTQKILRIYVSLGKRAVADDKATKSTKNGAKKIKIYFTIEATFRVDYLIKNKLTKNEINEFSQFNAVHNVWPFWRQHVFETVQKAELPHLIVPFFRKPSSNSEVPKSKRHNKR